MHDGKLQEDQKIVDTKNKFSDINAKNNNF